MSKKMPSGFICECGAKIEYPMYVYAHWSEHITHTCDCGRKHELFQGTATESESGKTAKATYKL